MRVIVSLLLGIVVFPLTLVVFPLALVVWLVFLLWMMPGAVGGAIHWLLRKSPVYRMVLAEQMALVAREYAMTETADWFGTTGLPDHWERELPRYLRRGRGETIFDQGSVKAADLIYVGAFPSCGGIRHFWQVFDPDDEDFAYIFVAPDGTTTIGWDERKPPEPRQPQ